MYKSDILPAKRQIPKPSPRTDAWVWTLSRRFSLPLQVPSWCFTLLKVKLTKHNWNSCGGTGAVSADNPP